jgi:hypothetical protein
VELVTLRVRATLQSPPVASGVAQKSSDVPRESALLDGKKAWIYSRESLKRPVSGPGVITEYSATTFVPAGMRAGVDRAGNLVVKTGKRG